MIDFNINSNIISGSESLILGGPVELILQQVDMLFNTDINDVLGDESYGTNYDRYLYSTDISTKALESKVLNDLYNEFAYKLPVKKGKNKNRVFLFFRFLRREVCLRGFPRRVRT